jgi:hypothetical protein
LSGLKQVEPNAAIAGGGGGSELGILQAKFNAITGLFERQSEEL